MTGIRAMTHPFLGIFIAAMLACSSASTDSIAPPTTNPPPTNPPPTSSVTPLVLEDFSSYSSTANMMSDPRHVYDLAEDISPSEISLDATTGFGTSTKSMRYDWPVSATLLDHRISRAIKLPNLQEIWVEFTFKTSPSFSLNAGNTAHSMAYKLLHVLVNVPGRFGLNFENNKTSCPNAEGPNDDYTNMYLSCSATGTMFDGAWHTIRYHARLGATDFHEFWQDGVYKGSRTGNTSASFMFDMRLGANMNQGPAQAQSNWWGKVIVYDKDPGW